MQIDRRIVSGEAEEFDDPLRLAQRIGRNQMAALGKVFNTGQKLGDFRGGIGMLVDSR